MQKKIAPPERIQTRFGRPWDEVARLADRHTRAVQSWLSTRAPESERFEGLGVIAGSSGLSVELLNLALGCDFPAEVDDGAITAEIEAIKRFFARREVPWRWWIGPHPSPADIKEQLARHGLKLIGRLPAKAAPLARLGSLEKNFPPLDPEIRVWPAANRADLIAASNIRRIAFRFPEGQALTYFEDMAADWLKGDPARLFLARLGEGPPAAIGALIMGAGLPGIYIMATLPEWGRRGLGKAIMARLVSEAAAAEYPMLTLTAGDQGYGLYRQFGFEHLFSYSIFSV